jgi:hypothetical protein
LHPSRANETLLAAIERGQLNSTTDSRSTKTISKINPKKKRIENMVQNENACSHRMKKHIKKMILIFLMCFFIFYETNTKSKKE